MDVSVLYKRAQRWLHEVARPAVFGNGMLERARATSLALLGFTAAVGLAIVALAANQGWPLIAGSSIPTIPPRHAAVGPGLVVAGLEPSAAQAEAVPAGGRHPAGARGAAGGHSGGASPAAPDPAPSSELIVSPSVPTPPRGGDSPGAPKPAPEPTTPPTQPTTTAHAAAPVPVPATQPTAPPETPPPTATNSEAPPEESESDVPSWSHGHGHAYGHDSSGVEGDDEWDDEGDEWDAHDHGHGHHH
jgi:hypothetical protein